MTAAATHHTIGDMIPHAPCDRTDAELLMAYVCHTDRAFVIAHNDHTLTREQCARFRDLAARRADGEPLAYLTGSKEFYGRAFTVTPATLIPRPETELLVEHALTHANNHITNRSTPPLIIADVGTGSGAIIVTLAVELAGAHATHNCGFIGTDISRDALTVADANARTYDVADQIAFIEVDLLTPFLQSEPLSRMLRHGAYLLVCANLPYVDSAQKERLLAQKESRALAYEPPEALWACDGGLALYKRLAAQLATITARALRCTITVLCEIDPAQTDALTAHIRATHGAETPITVHRDLADRSRLVAYTLTQKPPRR